MLTIKIYDAKGKLLSEIRDVPDDADPSVILDHLTQTELEDPHRTGRLNLQQAFKIRVENEEQRGYWILLGELKTPEIEHPRRN